MNRSLPSTVSVPQRLAACALILAGALCLVATGEGLRLREGSVRQLTNTPSTDEAPSLVGRTMPVTAAQALDNARANLAKANAAFVRADGDEAARFALTAQDDLEVAKSQADALSLASGISDVEAGLQHLRQEGRSREQARREAAPMFDFFRGFRDWGNPDAVDEDADSAPSAHPLGPAQPLANSRHIMASLPAQDAATVGGFGSARA
jgi:hypothetical protein